MKDFFNTTKGKIFIIIVAIIIISGIVYNGTTNAAKEKEKETISQQQVEKEKPKEEEVKKEPPLKIEQLPLDIQIKEPDSIGNIYIDATYTNNSNKNIVGYNVTVLLKDSNKTTYLMTYNTVLPGETSPKFNSFGPQTKNKEDIQILKYEITIANSDGTKTNLEYDNKLKQYKWIDIKK
jgi:hypothetical protein